jgi:hypothetical protein
MRDSFQDAVSTFEELKKKFEAGDLSRQQFIDEMKKLRLKDAQGRYWMIGAQTGRWYYFDGRDWIASDPPPVKDKGVVCLFCGFENKEGADSCGRCGGTLEGKSDAGPEKCPECGETLSKPLMTCPRCEPKGADLKGVEIVRLESGSLGRDGIYALRAVKSFSLALVLGILGALSGAVYGAFAGATGSLAAAIASLLPAAVLDQQGKLLGAVIDGSGGAAAGFLLAGLSGWLLALLLNFVLKISGGLKLRLTVPYREGAEPQAGEDDESDRGGLGFNLLKD